MRRVIGVLFLLCALSRLGAEGNRVVVVTDRWPPYRIEAADGSFSGIDIDFLRLLETKLGVSFEIRAAPWARCLEMMKNGSADLMTGLAWTAEREVFVHYVRPAYDVVRPAFYVHRAAGTVIEKYEDLKNLSIGYTRGSAYFQPFDSDAGLAKVAVADESQLLLLLQNKRVDAIVGTNPQLDYDIKTKNLGGEIVKATYTPRATTPLYVAISRKSSFLARLSELEKAVEGLVADGSVKRLVAKYVK